MTGWTPPLVLDAAAHWVWVPDGADQILTSDYQLIRYPDRLTDPAWPPAQVAWSRTSRPMGEVIDEVAGHVRAWGLHAVDWWVSDTTAPADSEQVLRARAGTLTETLQVLGYELGGGPPQLELPGGISVEVVHDERTVRAAARLETQGWGRPEPDETDMADRLAEVTGDRPDQSSQSSQSSFRLVAFLDHRPVAVAGYTLAGPVARLWGAVTLPAWQGRGAYRWLLAERLRLASAQGATLALVKGRAATSGPILRRAGFTDYGQERRYRLPLARDPEPGRPPR